MNFKNRIKSIICCMPMFFGVTCSVYAMEGPKLISQISNNENSEIKPEKGDYMVVYKKDLPNDVKWDERCTHCRKLLNCMFYDGYGALYSDHVESKMSGEFADFHDDNMCFIPYEKAATPLDAYKNTPHHLCLNCMENYMKPHLLELADKNNLKSFDEIINYYMADGKHGYDDKDDVAYERQLTLPQEFRSCAVWNNQLNSQCAICLNPMLMKLLNTCICSKGHMIHEKCLGEYKEYNKICPICKSSTKIQSASQYIDPKILMGIAFNERMKKSQKKCIIF